MLRHPRALVIVGGQRIRPIECTVHLTTHQSADTFNAILALDKNGLDEKYWADTSPIPIEIIGTNDAQTGGWVSMIVGNVDKPEIDLIERTVRISGRDATAKMINKKTNERWQNKKASEIVKEIAGRHGLKVKLSDTLTKAGLQYKDDHNRISDQDSEWNVIIKLAKQEGCVAFVKGDTLYFRAVDSTEGDVYKLRYAPPTNLSPARGTFTQLRMVRDLNLAKKISVRHRSYQHKTEKVVDSTYESEGAGDGSLDYDLRGANLTQDQNDQIASRKLAEIASHERTIVVGCPGDTAVDPRMMISLSGTGTGFDQEYMISTVEHIWSEGYRMLINVRNKDIKRSNIKKRI